MNKDDRPRNLAGIEPAPQHSVEVSSPGQRPTRIHFSAAEVGQVWSDVMSEAGNLSNDEFKKAFEAAIRTRAMRKLFLFAGDGLELQLATGPNWKLQSWLANEEEDGSIVLEKSKR